MNASPRINVRIGAGTSVHSLIYINETPFACGAEGSNKGRRPSITQVDAPLTCNRCIKAEAHRAAHLAG